MVLQGDKVVLDLFLIVIFPIVVLSLFYWLWKIRIQSGAECDMMLSQQSISGVIVPHKFMGIYYFYGWRRGVFWYFFLLLMILGWYLIGVIFELRSLLVVDCVFLMSIFVLIAFDARYYLLPDPLVYMLLWVGLLMSLLGVSPVPLDESVLGVMGSYLVMLGVYIFGLIYYKREAMGRGDLKYAAAIGAWIGVEYLFLFLFLSAGFGVLYGGLRSCFMGGNNKLIIPFGPFLGFSGIIIYFILKIP